ncbi:MAG: hypothetical protein ABGU93_08115 [Acetobacterium sp.]|uniref:hypothetical protein n=1 Tax=Acetobacterium sp. TaxID=1872094 RepID=UPI003242EB32
MQPVVIPDTFGIDEIPSIYELFKNLNLKEKKQMRELEYLKGFDEVDKFYKEKDDVELLYNYAVDRILKLTEIMSKIFSEPMSIEKQNKIIVFIINYWDECQGKSLEETCVELSVLLHRFERDNTLDE